MDIRVPLRVLLEDSAMNVVCYYIRYYSEQLCQTYGDE